MRAATEGSLPLVMPQGNLVEVLRREVRQGSPGELMVESSSSRKRRPPLKTNKEMSDEAADTAALTYYLLTRSVGVWSTGLRHADSAGISQRNRAPQHRLLRLPNKKRRTIRLF